MQLQEMEAALERDASQRVTYRILVATGSDLGAGTDSRIFCTLYGEDHRSSGEFPLATSLLHTNKFERCQVRRAGVQPTIRSSEVYIERVYWCLRWQVDLFEWCGCSLGRIHQVMLRTDSSGLGSDWQLNYLIGERGMFE
jgi:hypothetical protein